MPSRISEAFARVHADRRMAFMPFITAGDPDLATMQNLVLELAARGVDLIEVGFPYSDPIADGPVIQASYTRVLDRKLHVRDIFAAFAELTKDAKVSLPPLVAMVAYSIIFRTGPETFVRQAKESGFSGMIVPDLPGDEADDLAVLARKHGLDLVQLVAPTTPPARAERILKACTGFVYCISVAGTTGVRQELPEELRDQLKWLRTKTQLPLAVGFGISRPEQVGTLRGTADGVIVGSAIVRQLEPLSKPNADAPAALRQIGEFAGKMVEACRG
jgi:tryptophan synthase alpha chain